MRIEHGEIYRPEHLPDVEDIADYRVVDSFHYGQLLGPADRAFLREKRGDTRNSRQRDQWNFFQYALPHLTFDSIERPVVQKQEHKRQCYQHRLRHEATSEDEYHDEITPDPWRAHVVHVGKQCEREKNTAKHVFSFCYPGNRFYAQRMNCKDRRNKSTAPKCIG